MFERDGMNNEKCGKLLGYGRSLKNMVFHEEKKKTGFKDS